MNKERTKITGFPAPEDLIINGELQTPIKLNDGFYYDRRGVSSNTVFIEMTFEQYSKLKTAPSTSELKQMIIDKNPIIELYNCPSLSQNSDIKTINRLIQEGFPKCKKVINTK
jgi:hypothetical protein